MPNASVDPAKGLVTVVVTAVDTACRRAADRIDVLCGGDGASQVAGDWPRPGTRLFSAVDDRTGRRTPTA